MKYLVITGSFPPNICGVGDYTACLMNAADKEYWSLYYASNWPVFSFMQKIRDINSYKCDVIFLQYPTQGYGWSLLPQLLCIFYSWFTQKRYIVVSHESSQRTLITKIASLPLLFANKVIFTNEFEKKYSLHWFPFRKKAYYVVRILSNIKSADKLKEWEERYYDLVYFGHIRPCKGLEDFYKVLDSIQKKRKVKVAIIGQVLPEFAKYIEELKKQFANIQVDYLLNNTSEEVSNLLNNSKIVFLPFPDGISERRGSFLAAIANGALVVTYRGPFVTSCLNKICYFTCFKEAEQDILSLLDTFPDSDYYKKRELMAQYLSQELPSSWAEVLNLYSKVL